MRYLLSALLLVFTVANIHAQATHPCGIHYYDSIAIANDPEILERRAKLDGFILNYSALKSANTGTLIIPVVVHVLHQYGSEHLAPSQIESGINKVNLAYKAENSNISSVITEFEDIIGTAQIELRLAKLDPNGDPTTGIVYYDTPVTINAHENVYSEVQNWNPSHYLNIWSVLSTESGAAAWSHYPGVSPSSDGIVSMAQFINSNDHTIAHELGHFLNLPHPWGDSNEPALEDNCDSDDGIEDTPNTIGIFGTCSLEQESCGSLDNIQNIMDYSSCPSMFTMGQVTRMRAALNSGVGDRDQLWAEVNLKATGVHDDYVDPGSPPVADFKSMQVTVCPGSSVDYEDFSSGGEVSSYEWTFEGGNPASSTAQNPTVSYANAGEFSASLKVSNSKGAHTLTRAKHVRVSNTAKGIIAPKLVTMEDTGFPEYGGDADYYWTFENLGTNQWEVHKADGNTAMRINNKKVEDGIFNAFITSNINLSSLNNPDEITFDYAFAQRQSTNKDQLKVYVSNNCGKKWALRTSISGDKLITNGGSALSDDFIPTQNEWTQGSINFEFNATDDFVMLKFEMTSGGGNYLYVDNINIGGVTHNIESPNSTTIQIFPNPAHEQLSIRLTEQNGETTITIVNLQGQKIWSKYIQSINNEHIEHISLKDYTIKAGVYFVTVKSDKGRYTKRVVVNP